MKWIIIVLVDTWIDMMVWGCNAWISGMCGGYNNTWIMVMKDNTWIIRKFSGTWTS